MKSSLRNFQYVSSLPRPSAAAAAAVSMVYSFNGSTFNRFSGGAASTQPTEYTLAGWFRPAQVANPAALVFRSDGNPDGSWSHAVHQFVGGWNAYTFDGGVKSITGLTAPANGTWAHVAVTAKNSGYMHLYVNGYEEGLVGIGSLWTGGNDWWVARDDGSTNVNFSGYACDVAIWLKQLTSAEIFTLANPAGTRGLPPTIQPASLILFLP